MGQEKDVKTPPPQMIGLASMEDLHGRINVLVPYEAVMLVSTPTRDRQSCGACCCNVMEGGHLNYGHSETVPFGACEAPDKLVGTMT